MAEVLSVNLKKIKKDQYILLSAHREENIDNERNFFELMNAVNALAEIYQMPIIYSTHPRSKKYILARGFNFHSLVKCMPPFNFTDYNCLQINAYCVVSDSGTLPEEATYFNAKGLTFPSICIRTSTERPEALDKGNFVLGNISKKQICQAVDMAVRMLEKQDTAVQVPDYVDENVSMKVVRIIQSYTGIIDRFVWRKEWM